MLALTYYDSNEVRVDKVSDPAREESDDIIIKITTAAICGSAHHLYRGKIPGVKIGDILGYDSWNHRLCRK